MNKKKLIAGLVTGVAVIAIFGGILSINSGVSSGKDDIVQSESVNTDSKTDEGSENDSEFENSGAENDASVSDGSESEHETELEQNTEEGSDSDTVSVEISPERLEQENTEKAQMVEYIKTHDTINFTIMKSFYESGDPGRNDRQIFLISDIQFGDHIVEETIDGNLYENEEGYYTSLEEKLGINPENYEDTYTLFSAVINAFGLPENLEFYHINDALTEDERTVIDGSENVTIYTSVIDCPAYKELISEIGEAEILSTSMRLGMETVSDGIKPVNVTLCITYEKENEIVGCAMKSIMIGSYNKEDGGDCTCVDLRVDPDCDIIGCDPTCEIIDICQE